MIYLHSTLWNFVFSVNLSSEDRRCHINPNPSLHKEEAPVNNAAAAPLSTRVTVRSFDFFFFFFVFCFPNPATLKTGAIKRRHSKAQNRQKKTTTEVSNRDNDAHRLCMKPLLLRPSWTNLFSFRRQVPLEIIEKAVLMFKALLIS